MPVEHVWTEAEMESGLRAFMAARELWNIENNYTPGSGPMGGGLPEALVLTA